VQHHARHPASHGPAPRGLSPGCCPGGRRTIGQNTILALRLTGAALAAALVSGALAARPAAAAEGLYLTWNDCSQGSTAVSNRVFDCLTNSGSNELYCAFIMPLAAGNVVAVEIVMDIQHSDTSLPDWWRLDVGGCHEGNIQAFADPWGRSACNDMWQGTPAIAGIQGYIPAEPRGAGSQARVKVAASVLPQDAVSVDGSSMYYAARIVVNNDHTVGTPSCGGCDKAACLVLNSILVGRVPGSPGGDYFLQTPGPGAANWARWQGGVGADCAAVPVRNVAWGQVKSLYR
jgi:hypothetical protein